MRRLIVIMVLSALSTIPLSAGHGLRMTGTIIDVWSVDTITVHEGNKNSSHHKALYITIDTGDRDIDPTVNVLFNGDITSAGEATVETSAGVVDIAVGDKVLAIAKLAHSSVGFPGEDGKLYMLVRIEVVDE